MVAIAATMFIALFGWGQDYFHWSDPSGKVQLALFTSFILGNHLRLQDQGLIQGADPATCRARAAG